MQVEERLSFQESKKNKNKNCDAGISGRFISRPAHCFDGLIKFYYIVLISKKKKKILSKFGQNVVNIAIAKKKKITYLWEKLYKMIRNE